MIKIQSSKMGLMRGDTVNKLLRFKKKGVPVNLANVKRIDMHVRFEDKLQINLSTLDSTIIVLNEAQGEVVLRFSPELTTKKKFKLGVYDVQFIHKNKAVKTVLRGSFILDHDVTRDVEGS